MFRKYPERDSLFAFSNQEIEFGIEFSRPGQYWIEVIVNGKRNFNESFEGEMFPTSWVFDPGEHRLKIIVSKEARGRRMGEEEFEWEIISVNPEALHNGPVERSVEVLKNIVFLVSVGHYGTKAVKMLRDYYDSASAEEKQLLEEQTEIQDYLDD